MRILLVEDDKSLATLVRDRFTLAVSLRLLESQRPRPNETHVAPEDVPELRKLVHGCPPQDAAHTGDTRIVLPSLDRPELRVCVGNHRAELPASEAPSAVTHPIL